MRKLTGGKGVDYVLDFSGAPNAVNEAALMVNRGGKICLAAFPSEPVLIDVAHLVRNNIYIYGIRGEVLRVYDDEGVTRTINCRN